MSADVLRFPVRPNPLDAYPHRWPASGWALIFALAGAKTEQAFTAAVEKIAELDPSLAQRLVLQRERIRADRARIDQERF